MSARRSRHDPAEQPATARRAPQPRSLRRSLASIVLGFELVVVFLAALVIFGLNALPSEWGIGREWALVGGAVMLLLMVATLGLLRHEFAYWLGWALQIVLVLSGFLNPALFFVGALFIGMWAYCMITGSRIDRQNDRLTKEA